MSAPADLVIVGASTRAAAFSALRAGLRPWCADLFADLDLQVRCRVRCVTDYPAGLVDAVRDAPQAPLLYTGGLENRPELVQRLGRLRPLWGNGPAVLRQVRSPTRLRTVLLQHGIACPAIIVAPDPEPCAGRWLLKPIRGAGGTGIRFWTGRPLSGRRAVYLQEYIDGESCAALYVGDGRRSRLLGVTRQLVGADWLHAAPFHYCGSVGPLALTPGEYPPFVRLGEVLTEAFGLSGLFGVDGVLRDGVPYPVEVNPRYTASVEVLEYATGLVTLLRHRTAFAPMDVRIATSAGETGGLVGKAVYFAPRDLVFPAHGPWLTALRPDASVAELPAFADIPAAGQPVPAGRPVLSCFVRGDDPAACLAALRRVAAELDRLLVSA